MEFEKYHPIMTTHYVLDWLTTYKVKDVHALRSDQQVAKASGRGTDDDIMATAAYVNHMMSMVMNNNALVWGIGDKYTNEYFGTFTFWNFNDAKTEAEIGYELLTKNQRRGVMGEVLTHMISFAFDELKLTRLVANTGAQNDASKALLTAHGFMRDPQFSREDATASGQPMEMWRYVLDANQR